MLQEGTGARPNWQWGSCHIPRGDLQTTFLFKGFDEARRLGLNRETEAEVRAALAEETADVSVPGVNACCAMSVHMRLPKLPKCVGRRSRFPILQIITAHMQACCIA